MGIASIVIYIQDLKADVKLKEFENATLQANVNTQKGVIEGQHKDLKDLRDLRVIDSDIMMALHASNQKLIGEQVKRSRDRTALGKTNVQVKDFLDAPVPDDLRRMLNQQTVKYRGAGKASGVDPSGVPVARPADPESGRSPSNG